jgi:CHAT domain-containing protein/tetratricopeptide (TPR) repeat protein
MKVKWTLFVLASFFHSGLLASQYPDRDSVSARLMFLKNSNLPYAAQLNELQGYERQFSLNGITTDSIYINTLLAIGVVEFRLAKYNQAILATLKAIKIIESNKFRPAVNNAILNKYYYYLSIYYDSLKMIPQKFEAIDSCISNELRINKDYHYASLVLQSNVRDLYMKGDYYLCAERASLGESLIRQFYRYDDSIDRIIFYIYFKANSLRAMDEMTGQQKFLESKKPELAKSASKNYTGIVLSLYGNLYEAEGDFPRAIRYYNKAFQYDRLTSRKQISTDMLSRIGDIYFEKLDLGRQAILFYLEALSFARLREFSGGSISDSFYILGNIANVYAHLHMADSADNFFRQAFDRISPGINENNLIRDLDKYSTAATVESIFKLISDKANSYWLAYESNPDSELLSRALTVYKNADRFLTRIREEQREMQSRLFWQTDAHNLYERAIRICYLLKNNQEAFYFFEKSRAVLLKDQLNQQLNMTVNELFQRSKIQKRILALTRELNNPDSGRYLEIQKALIIEKQSLARIEKAYNKKNGQQHEGFPDSMRAALQELQTILKRDGQSMLEIFSGDLAVYALRITADGTKLSLIDKSDFDTTANSYIGFLSNPGILNRRMDMFIQTANHLYRLLFSAGDPPGTRIVISPDGKIFPFESLITKTQKQKPEYFLTRYAVSYTYSAQYLTTRYEPDKNGSGENFLGVAPVSFLSGFSLPDLEGSDRSLSVIGSYFSGTHNLIAGEASRMNFQQQFNRYKIIQLYTHASDTSSRGEPVIYFADSALYLSELIPEDIPHTQLIVLSACETGNGKLYRGEGVFSFNRGFANMGIPASIANLWSVDNKSSYRINELFYKFLSQGLAKDIALQRAKLEFIKNSNAENKLPYYWAATVLTGKSDTIEYSGSIAWIPGALIMGLTAIGLFIWKKSKKKTNPSPDKAEMLSYSHSPSS